MNAAIFLNSSSSLNQQPFILCVNSMNLVKAYKKLNVVLTLHREKRVCFQVFLCYNHKYKLVEKDRKLTNGSFFSTLVCVMLLLDLICGKELCRK